MYYLLYAIQYLVILPIFIKQNIPSAFKPPPSSMQECLISYEQQKQLCCTHASLSPASVCLKIRTDHQIHLRALSHTAIEDG